MEIRKLLLLPSDISKMTDNGTMAGALDNNKIVNSSLIAEVSISVPIVTDDIVNQTTHLSSAFEQKKIITKAEMTSDDKNILVDVDLEDLLVSCLTGTEMLDYIKENNKLIYIASAKSLLTNNVIDIYYHSEDKCIYVCPELSAVGNPPKSVSGLNISIYRVAPLNLEASLNSSTMFSNSTKYHALNFKDDITNLDAGLAVAKTDIAVYTLLVQGLNTYAVQSEYSRNTETGGTSNNLGKDRPVHLIVLEKPAEELLSSNYINSSLIVQATPYDWRLRTASKNVLNKIAFPLHI